VVGKKAVELLLLLWSTASPPSCEGVLPSPRRASPTWTNYRRNMIRLARTVSAIMTFLHEGVLISDLVIDKMPPGRRHVRTCRTTPSRRTPTVLTDTNHLYSDSYNCGSICILEAGPLVVYRCFFHGPLHCLRIVATGTGKVTGQTAAQPSTVRSACRSFRQVLHKLRYLFTHSDDEPPIDGRTWQRRSYLVRSVSVWKGG